MADPALKDRIKRDLEQACFHGPDERVLVSDGSGENVHLLIVSPRFRDADDHAHRDLIWGVLVKHLRPEDWGHVTLSAGASPELAAELSEEELMAL